MSRVKTARRLIPLSLALVFICVTLGGVYMTGFVERRLIYHPEKGLTSDPSKLGLAYEDVVFTAGDDVQLHGWYVPGSRDVTFLWFHGNAGNISHRLGNLKEMHDELAVNIFIFDYRGYGQSQGTPSEQGTYLDAKAALDSLKSREDLSTRKIVYYGRSLGGALAVELATQEPPYGLVLESSFPSVPYVAQKANPYLPLWRLLRTKYDSAAKVPHLQVPLLQIHGDSDDTVPLEAGKVLFEAANTPKDFYVIPGADHNDTYLVGGMAYWEKLREFIDSLSRSSG